MTRQQRWIAAAGTVALGLVGALTAAPEAHALSASAASAAASAPATADNGNAGIDSAGYGMTVLRQGTYAHPTDTPAAAYIDSDGSYWFQQSAALYGAKDPRYWEFYTGSNFTTATRSPISDSADPSNPIDNNNDTTWRCNSSPTGVEASPSGGYVNANYCDLVGVWVDPDSGDWYGLVHNEFTGHPFGDGLHFDGIDSAVSHDKGKTWAFLGHVITSPYSTVRGDKAQFPGLTYNYGDGDPRLYVDQASGYFYVYYGSRVLPQAGGGAGSAPLAHAARAKMSDKFAPGSFTKWYDGSWSQPGIGGKESNMTPVLTDTDTGYTPLADDYDPSNLGTVAEQQASGELPTKSPLFIMNVAYNAYLGLYIGSPEIAPGGGPGLTYYATKSLATNRWEPIARNEAWGGGWYRWFIDEATLGTGSIIGRDFRAYCSIECTGGDGVFGTIRVEPRSGAAMPIDETRSYTIANADGLFLGNGTTALNATNAPRWQFAATRDGAYQIVNQQSGTVLGVDSTTNAGRAWGAKPRAQAPAAAGPTTGQQWFIIENRDPESGRPDGTVRIVNRYSGLDLALTGEAGRAVETAPGRAWSDSTPGDVGTGRTAAQQTLTLRDAGPARTDSSLSRQWKLH